MKKNLLVSFIAVFGFISIHLKAQNIDSISVELTKTRDYNPWQYTSEKIDSFAAQMLISTLYKHWSGMSWDNTRYYHNTYSGPDLTTRLFQTWDTTQWVNTRQWTYTYSTLVDSILSQMWNSAWINDSLTLQYHNSIGLDSLIIDQRWITSAWRNSMRQEFTYAPDSSNLSQTFSNWDTSASQWSFNNRTLWLKDSSGTDTAIVQQQYSAGSWINDHATLFHFDSNNVKTGYTNAQWSDADSIFGFPSLIVDFTYDSLGQLTYIYADGIPGGFGETSNTYDSLGNIINVFNHYESQGGIVSEQNIQTINYAYPSSNIYLFAIVDSITTCTNDSIPVGFFAFGGTGPLHFLWSPSASFNNDTLENPYLIVDSTSDIIVTVTDTSSNSMSDTLNVTVNESPVITNSESVMSCIGCHNGQFILTTSGGTGAYHYSITPNPGASFSGDTIGDLPGGIYTICVTANGCMNCIEDTILEDNIGIVENQYDGINLFPNPFSSITQLKLPENAGVLYLEWFDQLGKKVRVDKLVGGNNSLSKGTLTSGYYFGILRDESKIVRRFKIIIR